MVLSLPLLLNWAWDIFSNYKWIRIKQKLPFRLYIGINKIPESEIRFNTITYLDINEDTFIESKLIEYAPFFQQYSDYFNREYKNHISQKWGIEINILAELSRGVWLGFSSIVTLLINMGLEKVYSGSNYVNSENIDINDFLNTNTSVDRLFRKTLKLNKDLWKRVNKIENQIASFFDSYYPIVSFTEDIDEDISNLDVEKIKMYGFRLNNLEKSLPPIPFIPIDYGLIYSGRPVLTDYIVDTNENSFNWTGSVEGKLREYFWDIFKDTLPVRKPIFYKTFVHETKEEDEFKETYGKLMGTISLEILNTMTKLYSSSYTESTMANFIDAINKIRYGNYITRKNSKTFREFINCIFENFTASTRILWMAPSDTAVMWGTAIFTLPLEWLRKDLFTSVQKTQETRPWVKLLYANWIDGIENKGFILEQNIEDGIYSEFISKNSYLLKTDTGNSIINDISFIENNAPDWLTLDLVNRKIYLDGQKLTSKELHSQNTTVDILEILLENIWEDVPCGKFCSSSYTSNKNEMTGKIIIPLVKLIEENKKIKFPLICKWSIEDFYLKLEKTPLKINVIKKLF
ncbi:MAG: hypothetical protein ACD_78C00183G0005 [uncultured bacterium (gcode 4)]|uniref:Uncharacterized protein n=1 Tax=uncultured bacterium (gcode 4) TaxID=1234023 RepID=K1YXC6_9BACT|nr:MAG: hypothetical protein ACD_78C00183G0005 [uncultured bacterium (gcode 4)]